MFKLLPAQLIIGPINGNQITPGTIGTTQITPGAITTPLLAANAVTAAQIAANTITAGQIAAGTITGTQIAASVALSAPVITGGTITGAAIVADGSSGEFLAYTGAPATGNMLVSISGAAGSDSHSNAYAVGLQVHGSSGQSIIGNVAGGVASFTFPTGAAEEVTPATLQSFITSPGAAEVLRFYLLSAVGTVPNSDAVAVWLTSAAKNGFSGAAGSLVYADTSGGNHPYASWGIKGLRLLSAYVGDTGSYQAERYSVILSGSLTINTTALTQVFTPITLGVGTYCFEGQIVITPAAGGVASFEVTGPTSSSGVMWEDIAPGGAPYTNEGASYSDPAVNALFSTPTLTTAKHRITFRGSINVTTAGSFTIVATESGGASYVINSRVTYLHVFPVGP